MDSSQRRPRTIAPGSGCEVLAAINQELPDDLLSRSALCCGAHDALLLSGTCRTLLSVVTVTAHRLFATVFASSDIPDGLMQNRPRLLALLDRARSGEPAQLWETFAWAAAFGFTTYLRRTAAAWTGDASSLLDRRGQDGATPLCSAARLNQGSAVATLLELRADADRPGKGGCTPLFWAAQNGEVTAVQRLLESRALPIHVNKRGECPLGAALHAPDGAAPGCLEAMRLMGESLDAAQRCSGPAVRVLMAACEACAAPCVAALLDGGIGPAGNPPVAVPAAPVAGYVPALAAAATTLARRSTPASAAPGAGEATTAFGAVAVVAPLLQRPPAQRPRSAGARRGSAGGAGGPLAPVGPAGAGAGAAVAQTEASALESTPLLVAAGKGSHEIVSLLLEQSEYCRSGINATLPSGKSALYLAAERGDARMCARLLGAGALVDVATCGGRSALYVAVEFAHFAAVRAICKHAEVHHLLQLTPKGSSPVLLAERRGRPALIAPLLLCYHRHVRRRYLMRGLGDADDDVSHPYLTSLCLKFKDQLFNECEPGPDHMEGASMVSQTAKLARMKAKGQEDGESLEKHTSRPSSCSASCRHQRAAGAGPGSVVEVRLQWRAALDSSDSGCGQPAPARAGRAGKSERGRPQHGQPERDPSEHGPAEERGDRPQRGAPPRPEARRPAGRGGRAARRPWGPAGARRRPASADGGPQRGGRQEGGGALRGNAGKLWQVALQSPTHSDRLPPLPAASISSHEAAVVGVSSPRWGRAERREEAAAVEADDVMEELLAGYLSAAGGWTTHGVDNSDRESPRPTDDADMYSECSED
uniref:Uncharacterized protein n=1 Tax=Alexandrium monilatum TaxID=311494 RepID=A0A7S4VEW7_9DINO